MTFKSIHSEFKRALDLCIVPSITEKIPQEYIPLDQLTIPRNIRLADPDFNKPGEIEVLLGSGPTLSLLCLGQIDLSQNGIDLFLQKTLLGWVVAGNHSVHDSSRPLSCLLLATCMDLTKFWTLEEISSQVHFSQEENACENHFISHYNRDQSDRFIVALPFRENVKQLGNSRDVALKRFQSMEKRFLADEQFKTMYSKVMQEYIDLGHMDKISNHDRNDGFYLPHHAVMKQSSNFTKLRIVFDGSVKSKSGLSLNDTLMVGPTIQDDIFALLIRFRKHSYVFSADIEKMYRQFLIKKEDRKFQRILWYSEGEIVDFELNTVTFGLAPSAFLAIRCLVQLAIENKQIFPNASRILLEDTYVDNIISGTNSLSEVHVITAELIGLLKSAKLNLREWIANDPEVLENIEHKCINPKYNFDKGNSAIKTLGVYWNTDSDTFGYSVDSFNISDKITKRVILSDIAKIFDPLGLLGPVTLYAKMIIQRLWSAKIEWDESVPLNIHTDWINFVKQLKVLDSVSFERNIFCPNYINIQIHGFCDASASGYGACIYIRTMDVQGNIYCNLLCAKTRVAPLKTTTIPRLELCGASLLANLFSKVTASLKLEVDKIYLWSDSTIVLHWINASPHLLKTYVANRVASIQQLCKGTIWGHVRSVHNPADVLSRGQLGQGFQQNALWKHGPEWLLGKESSWPSSIMQLSDHIPEIKRQYCMITKVDHSFLEKFSSFKKLKRIISYCLKFISRVRDSIKLKRGSSVIIAKSNDYPTVDNLSEAETCIVKLLQSKHFPRELSSLTKNKGVNHNSPLAPLDPFLDNNGLIRVGGHLRHSDIPLSQKFPIILPRSDFVTDLIISFYHEQNSHAGIQTTLYAIRQKYWLINGRNQIRKTIRRCIVCFRAKPIMACYKMGDLPAERVKSSRPFCHVGVDFCGPFYIKEKKFRNRNKIKTYVSIFICMSSKAVHLEVVSDLSSESFLAAIRRFISRRGKPENIFSDNGTNFKGANNELQELHNLFNNENNKNKISYFCSNLSIRWHFIPPFAPNYGGLWESTVKRFKHHFKRVTSASLFTYEEFSTFACEIEAILNSRPLCPISTDPNDIIALTPGHFLIGNALNGLPEQNFLSIPSNKLSNWQHIIKVRQDFWTRWQKEYLNELNVRSKWLSTDHNIKIGTLVLLKENHLPTMQWPMARVTDVHPGTDNIVRTVTIKTQNRVYKRSVRSIAPLPISM